MFWFFVKTRKYTIKKLIFASYPRIERLPNETVNTAYSPRLLVMHNAISQNVYMQKSWSNITASSKSLISTLDDTVFYIPSMLGDERHVIFKQQI